MGPRDHIFHLGHGESFVTPPQNHVIAKVCFPGPQNWPTKIPGLKRRPWEIQIRSWDPKSAQGHAKNKRCAQNNHAECGPRNSKRSYMVQVMAQSHFWAEACFSEAKLFRSKSQAFLEQRQDILEQSQTFRKHSNLFSEARPSFSGAPPRESYSKPRESDAEPR